MLNQHKQILISWLGITDLKAGGQISTRFDEIVGEGPILGALKKIMFAFQQRKIFV